MSDTCYNELGDIMAKKKITENKKGQSNHSKELNSINSNQPDMVKKVIKCLIIILVIFGGMYGITVLILNHSTDMTYQKEENTTIQYREILAGTVFQKKDKEYFVLFYDANEDENNVYGDLLSDYEAKDDRLPIYYVDLGNSMNKSCISTESNEHANNAKELKINDSTLIRFKDQKIEDYVAGQEEIKNSLN